VVFAVYCDRRTLTLRRRATIVTEAIKSARRMNGRMKTLHELLSSRTVRIVASKLGLFLAVMKNTVDPVARKPLPGTVS
jgi:hypothetical protein